jgi:cytochrome P450
MARSWARRARRALNQVWMKRIDDVSVVKALLSHPDFADRAVLENALTSLLFAPFGHQETASGSEFETRSKWSSAALRRMPLPAIDAAVDRAFGRVLPSRTDSLLDTVRTVTTHVMVELAVGETLGLPLLDTASRAIRDIDRGIKMIALGSSSVRNDLRRGLDRVAADPERWKEVSFLSVAREEALALSPRERADQLGAVFLATGSIQVSDVVTHALIALAQNPLAARATDEALVSETIRSFPVNSSVTRRSAKAVSIGGHAFDAHEAVTIVPSRMATPPGFDPECSGREAHWSFGLGPRACPARAFAPRLGASLLARFRKLGVRIEPGYHHRRSLAIPVRAHIGATPPEEIARTPHARRTTDWARYGAVCLVTYPRALIESWNEVAGELSRVRGT